MSVKSKVDLEGMKKVSDVVATTLREMQLAIKPGMSSKNLDRLGGELLRSYGAKAAPRATYGFPGYTCISVNNEIAHGIPTSRKTFTEGDLVNIDVSAELGGYWSDNGCSFVLGEDTNGHTELVNASRHILLKAIGIIHHGFPIKELGRFIEMEAKALGFYVIRNLTGHGIGRQLHEDPQEVPNYYDPFNLKKFKLNSVVAIETFISTRSTLAKTLSDGWTLVGNKGGFVAQHEHTVLVGEHTSTILTGKNGIN